MKPAFAFSAVVLQATQALAYDPAASCDTAALIAAETHGVPPQVMRAITRVETGRQRDGVLQPWPWAVNRAGASHWFDTAQEAETFVQEAIDAGQSNIDIGCFQLNLHWHGEQFPSLQAMFDPQQNADYAARFLVENHERTGNWVDAVATYHSATPAHAEVYIEKVETVLAALGPDGDVTPQTPDHMTDPPPGRENRFPLLQPGGSGTLASLVPTGRSATPLFLAMP